MTTRIACTIALLMTCTSLQASSLPTIILTETTVPGGGVYDVSITSPPGTNWFIIAMGITNDAADNASALRSGWDGLILSDTDWDAGATFSQEDPFGGAFDLFSTGAMPDGIGTFNDIFGSSESQALVYWTAIYFASPIGPNETTSGEFEWSTGFGDSTAFVLLSGGGVAGLTCLSGEVGTVMSQCTGAVVPVPAAAWLFVSALVPLVWSRRRRT